MRKKNKANKKTSKYGNDVVAYYGENKKNDMYGFFYFPQEVVTEKEIHNIAVEIFGQSFYVDYDTFLKEQNFDPEILFEKGKQQ